MSLRSSKLTKDVPMWVKSHLADIVRAGLPGGLAGGVSIWCPPRMPELPGGRCRI